MAGAGERPWKIRPATEQDIPSILWMIQLLAECSNEPYAVQTEALRELLLQGYGGMSCLRVLIAELTSDMSPVEPIDLPSADSAPPSSSMPHNDKIVGHAVYYYTYSTCEGRCLYLEELFVREEYRSRSIGSALIQELAQVACAEECSRIHLQVLDWNTRAIKFYKRIGGKIQRDALTVKISQPYLEEFTSGESSEGSFWKIRPAARKDVPSVIWLAQLSSKAEGKANNVHISEKELLRDGFGTQGRLYFHVLVAELTSDATTSAVSAVDPERPSTSMPHDDRIVGLALYFYMYPPWSGKSLFLDHVFVRVEYRKAGVGTALMKKCAEIACKEGCSKMKWKVMEENKKAMEWVKHIGADVIKEWLDVNIMSARATLNYD